MKGKGKEAAARPPHSPAAGRDGAGPVAAGTRPQHEERGQRPPRQQPRPARSGRPFALRHGPSAGAAPLSARPHGRCSPGAPGRAGRSRSLPVPAAPGAVHDWSCSPRSGRSAAGRAAGAQIRAPRSSPRSAAADRRRRPGRCAPAREGVVVVVAAAAAPGGEVGQSAGGKMVGGGRGGSGRRAAAGGGCRTFCSFPGSSRTAGVPLLRSPVPLRAAWCAAPCPGSPGTGRRVAVAAGGEQRAAVGSGRCARGRREGHPGRALGAAARRRVPFPFLGCAARRRGVPPPRLRERAALGPPRRGAAGAGTLPAGLCRGVP